MLRANSEKLQDPHRERLSVCGRQSVVDGGFVESLGGCFAQVVRPRSDLIITRQSRSMAVSWLPSRRLRLAFILESMSSCPGRGMTFACRSRCGLQIPAAHAGIPSLLVCVCARRQDDQAGWRPDSTSAWPSQGANEVVGDHFFRSPAISAQAGKLGGGRHPRCGKPAHGSGSCQPCWILTLKTALPGMCCFLVVRILRLLIVQRSVSASSFAHPPTCRRSIWA